MHFGRSASTRIFIIPAFFLVSCIGPRKVDKWVDAHYGLSTAYSQLDARKSKKKDDFLTVTHGMPVTEGNSVTRKKTQNVLPLLFYWRWDYTNTTTLSPQLPVNTFTSSIQSYSQKALKPKLNGGKIELNVDSIPNGFILNDRVHVVWLVYAFSWDKITIAANSTNLVVSYKIINEDKVTKTGTVTVENTIPVLRKNYFQRVKNLTGDFLYQYDETIKIMSKKVADKIAAEL